MKSKKTNVGLDLTSGPVLKLLLIFSAPIILTNVIQQAYSVVDLLIIGQFVGPTGTVGVSVGGEISDYMVALAVTLASIGQVFVAQFVGAGDKARTQKLIGTIITVMMAFSLIVMVVILVMCSQILIWLQCPEEAFAQAKSYMMITAVGMPFIFGYNTICGILRGMGESRKPMVFVIIAAITNIILDLVLVMALGLESAGTAVATVVSQFGAFAAAVIYMYRMRERVSFDFKPASFIPDGGLTGKVLLLAFPMFVRITIVRLSLMWVNANINAFGLIAASTNNIGSKIQKSMEVLMFGMESAAASMVGQNLGARKPDRAKKSVLSALACSMAITLVAAVLFFLVPKPLYRIFTADADIISFGVTYLQIMTVMVFMNAFTGSLQALVTGCGHVPLNFVMGIMDGVSRVGFSLLFVYVFKLGVVGYFWGAALSRAINGVIVLIFFLGGRWAKRKLLTEK